MSNQGPYCRAIWEIGYYYLENYEYVNIPLCTVGMILNLLNVLVFTRKTMNSVPNLILTHLAFVDFLFLLFVTVNCWVKHTRPDRMFFYGWTVLFWYTADIFEITIQSISIFLTVQLAAWRYIAVVHPLKERDWCTEKITRNVVITGYIICCVSYAVPKHFSNDFDAMHIGRITIYIATSKRYPIMNSITNIVYGLVIKTLPSFVLAGLTSRIVVALSARKIHREQLSPSASTRSGMKNVEIRQQTMRSTTILLAVVALFFIAEFPRGILWLLRTINERDWINCYVSFRDILKTITNINASITFMVYFTLSQQFRTTFKSLFNLNKRTISYQTHTPLASGDTEETDSGRRITSEV